MIGAQKCLRFIPNAPIILKQQTIQKTYTTEISIVYRTIQAIIFCRKKKKKSQLDKREAENASPCGVNAFSSRAFGR